MYNRAEHWISMGMMTNLCNLDEVSVLFHADQSNFVQPDRDLMEFLKGGLDYYIKEVRWYYIYCICDGIFDNDNFSVEPIVNVKTYNDKECGEVYTYTPAIAVAFHQLLVSSLLSYMFRLQIVNKLVKALPNMSEANSKSPLFIAAETAFNLLYVSA
jgi:hypothetical protein